MPDSRYSAIPFPTYQPAMRNILTITNSDPVVITTTYNGVDAQAHNYKTGLIVQLLIPIGWGMEALNQFQSDIIVLSTTEFTMPIDTTLFNPFVVPALNPGHFGTAPQVVPIGEVTALLSQSTKNVLPYP